MTLMPPELVEMCLDHLQATFSRDINSLRSCALVCKAWVQPAERFIFETVRFSMHQSNDFADIRRRILQLHDTPPHLFKYCLHVDISFITAQRKQFLEFASEPILHALLPKFTRTKRLRLFGPNIITPWRQLPRDFVISLRSLISTSSLVDLDLAYWVFDRSGTGFLSLLSCCRSSLRSLGIDTSFSGGEESSVAKPVYMQSLTNLDLFYTSLPFTNDDINTPCLRNVGMSLSEYEDAHIMPSWVPCKLDTLVLTFDGLPENMPSFGNCTMRNLTLRPMLPSENHQRQLFWRAIMSFISNIPLQPMLLLEVLTLEIELGRLELFDKLYLDPLPWDILEESLNPILANVALRTVRILYKVPYVPGYSEEVSELRRDIMECAPHLRDKGILLVEVEPCNWE